MTDNKTVKVLFCSDGSELNIDISLQATLEDLKHQISKLKSIEAKYQRVFHLGREVKNSRRSLHALGIGRFNSFVVHLHSSKPKVIELASEKNSVTSKEVLVTSNSNTTAASSNVVNVNQNDGNLSRGRKRNRGEHPSASGTDTGTGVSGRNNNNHATVQSGTNRTEEVIDLLESDDEDIEVIEIDKRTRRR